MTEIPMPSLPDSDKKQILMANQAIDLSAKKSVERSDFGAKLALKGHITGKQPDLATVMLYNELRKRKICQDESGDREPIGEI